MAGPPSRAAANGTAEFTQAARRLFTGLGYDNTTNTMIADAAGVPVAAVAAAGGRGGLYRTIIADFYAAQNTMLDAAEADFSRDPAGIRRFLEHVLDFYLDHFDLMVIWNHRLMDDAADLHDIEESYRAPVYRRVAGIIGAELIGDSDFQMMANVFTWSLYGFVSSGVYRSDGSLVGAEQEKARAEFRACMTRLQELVLDVHFSRLTG
ncbi:hypothetical protein [Spirillospora sp. NPDC047279]|uniref:hypothetical protein n=1 Tax=Spirillospora sp. NPDC047279 TaxID=3155478 RepID=UPI0034062D29